MQIKQVTIDNTQYIAPNWEVMGKLVFELGISILKSQKNYDWIIIVARGGWTWGRSLADCLEINSTASIKAKLYKGINQTSETISLEQTLPKEVDIKNKKVLLFDDVADTGKTLKMIKQHLLENGAKLVDIATIFYKPHSKIAPNYFSFQTSAWIVFPHEIREFLKLTSNTWIKQGLNKKEIIKRFLKIGLPKKQIKYYLNDKIFKP